MTSHIQPLAAEARPVRSRGHRVKHDSRMLDRPPRRVGAVNVPYSPRSSSRWSHSLRAMFVPVDVIFQESTWTPPGAETAHRNKGPTCLPPIAVLAGSQ